jgi:hypothetical protein
MAASTYISFSWLAGTPNVGGANAVVADATLATFDALVSSKVAAHTTYTPPDGVRPFALHTPPWILELEGALRAWLSTHTSDTTAAFAAISTASTLPQFDMTDKQWDNYVQVVVASGRGGGTGLHYAVYGQFRITTDYRSVQKTGTFSADLASAMAAWS